MSKWRSVAYGQAREMIRLNRESCSNRRVIGRTVLSVANRRGGGPRGPHVVDDLRAGMMRRTTTAMLAIRSAAAIHGCERPHSHGYHVAAAVERGELRMAAGADTVDLRPGAVVIIPAGVAHHTVAASADCAGIHTLSFSTPLSIACDRVATIDTTRVHRQFVRLLKACGNGRALDASRVRDLVVAALARKPQGDRKPSAGPRVHPIAQRIKAMIDDGGTPTACFETIATRMPLSSAHCNRLFRRAFGVTIRNYALTARAERARILLHTDQPLATVAQLAGFYDQSQFTRDFLSVFHLTPGQYRRQNAGTGASV